MAIIKSKFKSKKHSRQNKSNKNINAEQTLNHFNTKMTKNLIHIGIEA